MPRNALTKEELRNYVLKLKSKLFDEDSKLVIDSKDLAHKYLNMVLDKIEEYRIQIDAFKGLDRSGSPWYYKQVGEGSQGFLTNLTFVPRKFNGVINL